MANINFRSLFAFLLLAGMVVGLAFQLDNLSGLFEREEVRESSLSESRIDKFDGTVILPAIAAAQETWSISLQQNKRHAFGDHFAMVRSIYLAGYTPRSPPFIV